LLTRFLILAAVCLSFGGSSAALADKRVALVIGNSAYKSVPRLSNPTNDANLVGEMFKNSGFDVVDVRLDLSVVSMRKALREFGAQARDSDVAVVYYAGHGIELDGANYLIPTDATLETDTDVYDETFPLDRVLIAVEPAKKLRLVILDACRDNPFASTMKRTIASRSVGRGLAKVEPNSPNTMIAFAAKAGSTASDGEKDSPFAMAIAARLPIPGLDLRKALGFVRDDVLKSTGNKQEPYVYGSLGGEDFSLVAAQPKPEPQAATGPQGNPQDTVRRDYELALQLGTRDGWSAFLAQYPDGFYAGLAKGQLNKIAAEETRAAAAEKARLAEQEKTRLAAEGARKAELEKAAAEARIAEANRIAAEKAKQVQQAKAEAAEKDRAIAESAVADKQASDAAQKVASLPPTDAVSTQPPTDKASAPPDLPRSVQVELRRVGCYVSSADGIWNSASQNALAQFNKQTGLKLETKAASADALDVLKSKTGRVCPLICDHGFKADGDNCVKIACRSGYRINDDNECEKVQDKKPVASREDAKGRDSERKRNESPPASPQASGQILCDKGGCRPVSKGCHLGSGKVFAPGNVPRQVEVCN
jgi:uncharacterized caspase-like protein